jgi:hypothetical protein
VATPEKITGVVDEPAQRVWLAGGLTPDTGSTTTIKLWPGALSHPLASAVIRYSTLICEDVVLVRVSLINPDPDVPGSAIPGIVARCHIKLVPAVALVGVYENRDPLQMAGGDNGLLSTGTGFTTTVTFCTGPVHPFALTV